MKAIILIISFIIGINVNAQKKDTAKILSENNGTVYYTGIVDVDTSLTKEQLFLRAKKWFAGFYVSGKEVMQVEDKEAGEMIGKGYFKERYFEQDVYVWHTVEILVKQGKFKYIITNFDGNIISPALAMGVFSHAEKSDPLPVSNTYNAKGFKKAYNQFLISLDRKVKILINDLSGKMSTKETF